MMKKIVSVLAVSMLSVLALPQSSADACGPMPEETVSSHFRALNAHDRTALLSRWQPNAPVTSMNPKGVSSTMPIEKAADRWLTTTKPVTFKVESVSDKTNGDQVAHVKVMFEDVPFDNLVTLRFDKGNWRIVEKTSRQLAPPASSAAKSALASSKAY